MSTPISFDKVPSTQPAVDRGLRSVQGIRWLLLTGGLVVAVSVVRLVAAEWGALGPGARFLTLVLGALSIYAAGDFTRHRLHLPVAGSAFLFLFAGIVPLLAWGAAQQRLVESAFGWPCLILGLGSLLAASDRVLRRVLAYRGGFYTATLGAFLAALPMLPYLEARWSRPEVFFIVAAVALGLWLRSASLHINRFFFHRDRLRGVERPVHWLPFGLMALIYLAGMSLLAAFSTHLALPLAFVAIALIDAGEEYFQALIRATGQQPTRWPRRSLAVLAVGFSALAASLAIAPLDAGRHSLALVALVATLRLLAWAGRYSSVAAHVCGLLAGIVAWHAVPALIPEPVRRGFELATSALGLDPRQPAIVSLADLGLLAALLAMVWALRDRWTPPMVRAHTVIVVLNASLLLLISLQDTAVARLVAPICALLLAAGVAVTRLKMLIPVLYQALVTVILAWSAQQADSGFLWNARSAWLLGVVNLVFLGGGLLALRQRGGPEKARKLAALIAWPPLGVSLLLLYQAWARLPGQASLTGLMLLVVAETCLLGALTLSRRWLYPVASLSLVAGLHCLVDGFPGASSARLSLLSQTLLLLFWMLSLKLARHRSELAAGWRLGCQVAAMACGSSGFVWLALAFEWSLYPTVEPLHLVLLGGILIAEELRLRRPREAGARRYAVGLPFQIETGLALLILWAPIQAMSVPGSLGWTFMAAAWLALAVAARIGTEFLERHDPQGPEVGGPDLPATGLARSLLVTATVCAGLCGAASLRATVLGGSPWLPILPAFLASLFFVFMASDRRFTRLSAALATGFFVISATVLLAELETFGRELYCLGPGLALLGLSALLRHEIDARWRHRLFTAGAACLYAMPVLGLLEELSWGWQIVLLLLSVAFGSASFRLRSRSLLIVSTAALMINLACFLIRLRQTEPLLLWVAGIIFGLGLMGLAGLLEHRREVLLQRIRIWGNELRSWA